MLALLQCILVLLLLSEKLVYKKPLGNLMTSSRHDFHIFLQFACFNLLSRQEENEHECRSEEVEEKQATMKHISLLIA